MVGIPVGGIQRQGQIPQNAPVVSFQGRPIDTSYKANASILSGDELIQKMGAPPKKDLTINLGPFGGVRTLNSNSMAYKETLGKLSEYHKLAEGLGDITNDHEGSHLEAVSALKSKLGEVIASAEKYIDRHGDAEGKADRRNVMGELANLARQEIGRLENYVELTEASVNYGTSINSGMTMLRGGIGNPDLVSKELTDDAIVGEPAHFGAGQVNQVSLVTYKTENGLEERVLKPLNKEVAQFIGKEGGIGIEKNDTRFAARNLASSTVASALGLDDMLPKPDIVVHNEQLCLAMPRAQGVEFLETKFVPAPENYQRTFDDDEKALNAGKQGNGNIEIFQAKKDENGVWVWPKNVANDLPLIGGDKPGLTASLQKGLMDLQVIDVLCGQVDRHAHNFFVHVDGDEARITGIDNDTAFGDKQNDIRVVSDGDKKILPPYGGLPPLMSLEAYQGLMTTYRDREGYSDNLVKCGLDELEVNAAMNRLGQLVVHAAGLLADGKIVENFETWTFEDPESKAILNASEFLTLPGSTNYVFQNHEAMLLAIKETGDPLKLDPAKHNLPEQRDL